MKTTVLATLAALTSLSPSVGHASPEGDRLSRCLADNTTGKERKDLARWVFVSMAAHPEIKPLAAVAASDVDGASRTMGQMVTTLLADRCAVESRAAVRAGGSALEDAFSSLGELAMGELMSDDAVNARLSGFERYLDMDKLAALDSP